MYRFLFYAKVAVVTEQPGLSWRSPDEAVVFLWEPQCDRRKRLWGRTKTERQDGTATKAGNAAQNPKERFKKKRQNRADFDAQI